MSNLNYGFIGDIPQNVNIEKNLQEALEYRKNHCVYDTLKWFKNKVGNHRIWDYKQLGSNYEDFGNWHYGFIGTAIGIPKSILYSAAGGAQLSSYYGGGTTGHVLFSMVDYLQGLPFYFATGDYFPTRGFGSNDDPKDQTQIRLGIETAESYGYGGNLLDLMSSFGIESCKQVELSISNPTIYEQTDNFIEFNINLSKPLEEDLVLKVKVKNGTATRGEDFVEVFDGFNGLEETQVKIEAGETNLKYSYRVIKDGVFENIEDFMIEVSIADENIKEKYKLNSIYTATGTIIDFPTETCPKPVTPNFSLNFPLPSAPSYYTPTYGGGSSGGSSPVYGGGGSSTYTPTPTPLPNVPYIPCYDTPEKNSALVMKVNTSANSNENSDNVTYETREANNNSNSDNTNSIDTENSNTSNLADKNETSNSENLNNETTQTNKIYFDYNNDGFKENMLTWFSKDEAVLVNDINNNGFVDNGSEILGNNYTNKFGNKVIDILSLLDEFDTNNDGIINNKDNTNLALWQDKNQNGKTDKDELIYFDDINSPIKSISLSKLDKLLSGYDRNGDLKISASDGIYNHIYMQESNDNSINLYIYGDESARAFLGDKTTNFTLQTNKGEVKVNEVVFYTGELALNNTHILGNDYSNALYGNIGDDILEGFGGNDTLYADAGNDSIKFINLSFKFANLNLLVA